MSNITLSFMINYVILKFKTEQNAVIISEKIEQYFQVEVNILEVDVILKQRKDAER